MSAIFKAELANLQILVARAEREREADTNERERLRTHVEARAKRLHAVSGRLAKSNRAAIVACLKKFARPHAPISANKVAELTGITDDTTRKHLRDLADDGTIVAIPIASGKQIRYHAKPGKA